MSKAEEFYKDRIQKTKEQIKSLDKVIDLVGWSRLLLVIAVVISMYFSYKGDNYKGIFIIAIIGMIIFMVIASYHGKQIDKRDKLNVVVEFNSKGLKRLSGEFKDFKDKGEDLIDSNHPFGNDIDIFGQSSLFQMINTTRTRSGRSRLGEILSIKKLPTKKEIEERQEAIKELAKNVEWREKLYVEATFKKSKSEELDELIKWCKSKSKSTTPKIAVSILFIILTMVTLFLSIIKVIPFNFLILDLMLNFVVIKLLTKDKDEAIHLFQTMKYNVKSYTNILVSIEDEKFQSEYLNNLKSKLNDSKKSSCKVEMNKLSSLLEWIGDSVGNAYFFLLNVIFFADVFILSNLNKWKDKNGEYVEDWLDVMGYFEALASISNLGFDYESWSYAKISDESEIKAVDMAHPLIGERAKANSYDLMNQKKVSLITGSNMSGKSTFLRTVGVNLILAYIGAPSRAKSFNCSIMNIYTCMRTKDNLEESISSFYAEILRIKLIIEACKSGEKVFFLLDEIFKGTNSRDRHIGARVLIKQLIKNKAMGLLSTHDLELCDLEKEMREIENYNFREYYEDNKINFDYTLRKGRSTTQNAVYLMKLAGIEFKE